MQLRHNTKIARLELILRLSSKISKLFPTVTASGRVYVSTKNCPDIFGGSCYTFQLNHSMNSKWQFFLLCDSSIPWAIYWRIALQEV